MKSRWILNLVLAAVVVALAAFVFLRPSKKPEASAPPLTAIAPESVQRIRLERPNQEPVVIARAGDDWRLEAPLKARADRFRVDGLLHVATAPVETRFAAPAGALAQYGLDKPQARLWLNGAEIRFGALHAFQNAQYVLYNGQVALIPAASFRAVASPVNAFFSTHLVEDKRKPIAFALPGFSLALRDGIWRATPVNKNVSNDAINDFVNEWRYARALSVQRATGARAKQTVRITYLDEPVTPASKPKTLDIGIVSQKPELVLLRKDEGLEYHFSQETADRLLRLSTQ